MQAVPACLALFFFLPALATAAEPRSRLLHSDVPESIRRALEERADIAANSTALRDVLTQLQRAHHINIVMDTPAVASAGVRADTPVTIQIKNVSLQSALDLLLRELKLDYTLRDEVVLITSRESADRLTDVRHYDVRDLLAGGVTREELVSAIHLALPSAAAYQAQQTKPKPPGVAPIAPASGPPPTSPPSAGDLKNKPTESAAALDNEIAIVGSEALVRTTFHGHRDVERLLDRLEADMARRNQDVRPAAK